MNRTWSYPGKVLRVIDGDTLELDLDLGLNMHHVPFIGRLKGINAWEVDTEPGKAAKGNLETLVLGKTVEVITIKNDKYGGRYVVDIATAEWSSLSDYLISTGWAAPWNGKGKKPLP